MVSIKSNNIPHGIELVRPFTERQITHVFHDVDGTHSLIRQWEPVMALVTGFVANNGMPERDSQRLAKIISQHDPSEFPSAQRFAVESAGLSALTQMEWALRNAAANGVLLLPEFNEAKNRKILDLIWQGEEVFKVVKEAEILRNTLAIYATELFRTYNILLKNMCRNNNLILAKQNPEKWRVPGSMEFLEFLCSRNVKNYFVTGAVIEYTSDGIPQGDMYEEIKALQLDRYCDGLLGSTWDEKIPKFALMKRLCKHKNINPHNVLIIGDGRSEIAAGVGLGALTMSRLNLDATRAREIHSELGVNIIVDYYDMIKLKLIFS